MSYWNLEASEDGSEWHVLHAARGDQHLLGPTAAEKDLIGRKIIDSFNVLSENEKSEYLLGYVEQNHRHTWTIDPTPTVFFRFFRLIGLGEDVHEGDDAKRCMHAVGLELYGEIHED
jgi:hypothetical protein